MKKILIGLTLLASMSSFAYDKTETLCMESGQNVAFIKMDIFEASNSNEKDYSVKYEYNFDGSLVSEQELRGSASEFEILKAKTEVGNRLFVVTVMDAKESELEIKQYVCQ